MPPRQKRTPVVPDMGPTWLAAWSGNISSVENLLADHFSPDEMGGNYLEYSALHIAIERRHPMTAIILIEANAQVNSHAVDGITPLHSAVRLGFTDVAKELIIRGAKLNAEDEHGHTPMYCAAMSRNMEVIQLLLDAKHMDVDYMRQGPWGSSELYRASPSEFNYPGTPPRGSIGTPPPSFPVYR